MRKTRNNGESKKGFRPRDAANKLRVIECWLESRKGLRNEEPLGNAEVER